MAVSRFLWESQSTTTPATRAESGLAVQKRIVGAAVVDGMYAGAADYEIHSSVSCRRTASAIT